MNNNSQDYLSLLHEWNENDLDDGSDSDWEPILDAEEDEETDDSSDSSNSEAEALLLRHQDSLDEDDEDFLVSKENDDKKSKTKPFSTSLLSPILALVLLLLYTLYSTSTTITVDFGQDESIYIPGLGFSGFWFTLGRLKSIPDPSSKQFVCFSAGCLGAVTILNNFTVDEMACIAQTAQTNWRNGNITRFQVVQQFVDGLVYREFPSNLDPLGCLAQNNLLPTRNSNQKVPIHNPKLLERLHILTTEKGDNSLVKATMRSPTNLEELRDMLIQTAWIPGATGDALTYKGHLDGGFSLWQHPQNCTKYVTLPLLSDAKLVWNSLNVNMGVDEAYRLWNEGLQYGL